MRNINLCIVLLFLVCTWDGYAQVKKPHLSPETYLKIREWQQKKQNPYEKVKRAYYVSASVKVADEQGWEVLEKAGCKIRTKRGNMATVSILMDKMEELSQNEHIAVIQVARKLKPSMDTVRVSTKVNEIQSGIGLDKPYTGKGVIVGIVDTGIDFTHPTFYDDKGERNRILCAWNQLGEDLLAPDGYEYGSEYRSEEELLAAGTDNSQQYHGTHVLGIAAGSGYGSPYRGIAPESDLIVVGTTLEDMDIVDGINYIMQKAEEANKPCVINLSLGNLMGPHDGTSLTCRWYNTFVEEGGYIMNSAGNAKADSVYLEHTVVAPADSVIQIFLSNYYVEDGEADFWTTEKDVKLQYLITDQGENIVDQSEYFFPSLNIEEPTTVFDTLEYKGEKFPFMFYGGIDEYNQKINLYISIENKGRVIRPLVRIVHSSGTVRGWSQNGFVRSPLGFTPIRADYSVGDELASDVLGVGAWVSRDSWRDISGEQQTVHGLPVGSIAYFSSEGPTLNKDIVPDIMAPGAMVVSSFSHFFTYPETDQVYKSQFRGKDYPWGVNAGTSMACPVVTGAVALWRQANPELSFGEIKEIMRQTAIPAWEMNFPNTEAGYGKINILGGLQEILRRVASIPESLVDRTELLEVKSGEGKIFLRWKEEPRLYTVAVFDLSGRKIYNTQTSEKEHLISAGLVKGDTYLLQVLSGNGVFSQKIVCR